MHAVVLRYLDSVARLGSIRRAAAALNVASSAVNRQILKLEGEMGTALFERRGNGVRLTAAGEHLLRHARHTLSDWQRTCSDIVALKGDVRGEVRVVTIPSLLVRVVPRAIEAVAAQHPHISFRVIDADPAEHAEEMRAGRPDIALLFIDKRQRGYEVITRLRTALGAIMRPDHPLASARTLSLTQCADYPVVMLNDPWLLDAVSETEFTYSGAQFSARVQSNSLTMMKAAMASGLGIGFFTPTGFVDEIRAGELVCVPLGEPGLASTEIGLFVHRGRAATAPVHVLVTELAQQLDDLAQDIRTLSSRTQRPGSGGVPSALARSAKT